MAIIYTYPIVTPQLQDLVVITDASDRNFTKQASIQDIIDLFYFDCTKCDYCTTSISEISPTAGDIVKALACDTGISFASSDASVIITGNNTTKTIDFKAVSGGGGGCPITYVLKPVYCKDGDCQIDTNFSKWIFSCDTLFADLSPGYIKDFTISGEVPGSDPCWYVEEATFGATASTCIECCPPAVLTFTSCDGIASISTLETNITGLDIDYINNSCWFITQGGTGCWNIETGGVDSGVAVVITASEKLVDCTCECCTYPCTFQYELCGGGPPDAPANINIDGLATADPCDISSATPSIWYEYSTGNFACYSEPQKVCEAITVPSYGSSGFDGICNHPTYCPAGTPTYTWENCTTSVQFTSEEVTGATIGKVYEFCCESPDSVTTECFEYMGDIGEPIGGTPPCTPIMETIFQHDDCDCCLYKCVYEYIACPDNSTTLPPILYYQVPLSGTEPQPCECDTPPTNPVFANEEGETWCYTLGAQTCVPPTPGLFPTSSADCADEFWCPTLSPPSTYTWQSCDDGGPHVTVAIDPGTTIGEISRWCCDEGEIVNYCFEYLGNIGETVGGSFPCDGPAETYPADCLCCEYPCTYNYEACPGYPLGFSSNIFVEIPWDETGCNCQTPDPDVYITIGDNTWCYNNPIKICVPASTTITGVPEDGCGDEVYCPTPDLDLRWKKCTEGPDDWRYEDPLDPITPPFNTPGNHYIGEIDTFGTCINGDCCIEVEETTDSGDPTSWSAFIGETLCDSAYNATWEDCNCCINYDVVEYTACAVDPVCEIEGVSYPTLYVDVCLWGDYVGESWKPSNAPQFMTLSPGGEECCYQKSEVPPCVPETLISTHGFTYDDLVYADPAWIDCTCTDIVFFQYRECGAEEWIDTNTDLEAYNNGGAWGDGIVLDVCYEIQEGGSGGPEIIPEDLFVTEYFGVGDLFPCDCCEQDLRQYNICDGAAGVTCNALAPATLYIDVSVVIGWDPATYGVIVGEEISSSIQCCYTLSEELPPCDTPTGTIITDVPTCEDEEACNLI